MRGFFNKVKAINNLARSRHVDSIKEKIIFFHIPKCGGTSITEAIKKCYYAEENGSRGVITIDNVATFKVGQILSSIDGTELHDGILVDDYHVLKIREYLMLFYLSQGFRFVNGHFTFSNIAHQHFGHEYVFITMLRDPVDRWISEYLYNKYKKSTHRRIEYELEEYLNTKYGLSQGRQLVKFLGGASESEDYGSEKAVKRAKANLEKIDIVGFIGHTDQFEKICLERFGRDLDVGHLNKNPVTKEFQAEKFSEHQLARIRDICKPDIDVYQHAKIRWMRQ